MGHGHKSSSSSSTVTKFYDSLRQLKSQFRQIYKRCTCSVVHDDLNKSTKQCNDNEKKDPTIITEDGHNNNNSIPVQTTNSIFDKQQPQSSTDEFVVSGEMEVGFILPSPPPTPRRLRSGTGDVNRPDANGDYLFKVTPPPFQDSQTTYSRPLTYKQPLRSRPCSPLQTTHFVGDTGNSCGHTISNTSIMSIHRDEEYQFKIRSIVVSSRPTSSPYSCPETTTTILVGHKGFITVPQRLRSRLSYINWKEFPKSQYLQVMFIPTWSSQVMRRAPYFSIVEKMMDLMTIQQRHEKVEARRNTQLEMRQEKILLKNNIWNHRRQVGLKYKILRKDNRVEVANVHNNIANRFPFIHWLSDTSQNSISIGRFFDTQEKRLVAIKIPDKTSDCLDQVKLKLGAVNEITSLIKLDHVNVIQIFTYFSLGGRVHVVLEACDHSLRCEILCTSKGVHTKMAHGVIYQIVNGLAHCHKLGCLHRDLCPDNILVTVEGVVKIADFSKSIFLTVPTKSPVKRDPGNLIYSAPELLASYCAPKLDIEYSVSADIWSIGVILIELIRGRVLWNGDSPEEQLTLIHGTVGPLLPQHCKAALIDERRVFCTGLVNHLPKVFDDVTSFIENCLEVDPSKRSTCEELLQHCYMKHGSLMPFDFVSPRTAEEMLPRMALWELRPHTAPLVTFDPSNINVHSSPIPVEESGQRKDNQLIPENPFNDKENENPLSSPIRTRTVVKSSKINVLFSVDPKNLDKPSCDSNCLSARERVGVISSSNHHMKMFPDRIGMTLGRDHSLSVSGCNSFSSSWNSFGEVHAPRALSKSILHHQECTMSTKRLPKIGKMTDTKRLTSCSTDMINPSCCCPDLELFDKSLPLSPKVRIQYIINVLPSASWNTVQMFTTQLQQSAKKNPKTFSTYIKSLTTALLDQITKSPKVCGPAIRILNNICKSEGKYFEPGSRNRTGVVLASTRTTRVTITAPAYWGNAGKHTICQHVYECGTQEAERIMESMLNKLGGPSFIEKEANEVLRHLVKALKPTKAIIILIKYGGHHKISASRLFSILLIDDALKDLELMTAFGLPGEQSMTQRKFSSAVFHMATRSLRDSNPHSRTAARDIYQQLMSHPGFWYLYQTSVPEEKRQWVNRLLDDIRRST